MVHRRQTSFEVQDGYPSVLGLAHGYRAGDIAPSKVVAAHLDRVARLDGALGAYQAVYADDALQQAEAADKLFAAGYDAHPFLGIPFVLKDICDLAGRVTTGGSMAMADRVSPATATIAARLLAAGGILLGKSKTVECALGGWGTNQHMGTPWNPWDMSMQRVPGGSSSGTGVAVASGMAVCGVGTDTGGSVRLPAAFCGLAGLKVTEGQLPTEGILPLSHTLDTPGPMARSVTDVALMYRTMRGDEGRSIPLDEWTPPSIKGMRFGAIADEDRDLCQADVLEQYDNALDVMRGLGAEIVPFAPPELNETITDICGRLITAEAWYHHGAMYADTDLTLDEDVRTRMFAGRGVSAADYMALLSSRQEARSGFLESMAHLDALITPTTLEPAPLVDSIDQAVSPGHFTRFGNYYGLCALSLPMGVTPAGLPTSLQVVARPNDEAVGLKIGRAYEAARGPFAYPEFA